MALLTVKMADDEYERLKARARAAGLSLSDFVRRAIEEPDEKVRRVAGELLAKPTGSITTPDGTRMDYPRETGARVPVVGHRHSAAKTIAGGIAVCECGARRTVGSDWRMP